SGICFAMCKTSYYNVLSICLFRLFIGNATYPYWKGTLVNVPSVIHCCSSFVTFFIAFQANVAHLIRAGKLYTPSTPSISSEPNCSASPSSPSITYDIRHGVSYSSCIGCPLTPSVIIEADARLMEQPAPVKPTSSTTSPSHFN